MASKQASKTNKEVIPPVVDDINKQADNVEEAYPYTVEQLKDAGERIKVMPPQVLLALEDELDLLRTDLDKHVTQHRGVAWVNLYRDGAEISVTERAHSSQEALDNLMKTVMHAKRKYHLSPVQYPVDKNGDRKTAPDAPPKQGEPAKTEKKTAPPPPPPSDEQKHTNGNGDAGHSGRDDKGGVVKLNKIKVVEEDEGRFAVEFYAGKFNYPFKEFRGSKVVSEKFDPDLGWTEEHFSKPATYIDGRDFSGLWCEWEHPDKYYNVIRIFAK